MLGGLNVTVRVRHLKFELRSKSTDRKKTFTREPVHSRSAFLRDPLLTAHLIIDLNYVRGKCGFWKKATRLPQRQSFPQ